MFTLTGVTEACRFDVDATPVRRHPADGYSAFEQTAAVTARCLMTSYRWIIRNGGCLHLCCEFRSHG